MLTRMTLMTGAACLVGAFVGSAIAASDVFPYKVHQKTLDNGLKVVVVPYDSPGIVAYFTVVRTGSRDEVEPGHSGFAHFFEHMMFRGTDRFSSDDYNAVLKRMGADSNAFTTDDYTNYYIIGPAAELETMMDIESDRFMGLKYSEDDFRREALAVLGEYNKNISSPFLPMYERVRDLAFEVHTYKHTTMGFLEDIKAMPGYYDYSLSFFDRFYRPENCIVAVVGDADPSAVFADAEKYYGKWQKGYQSPAIESDPAQKERKEGHVEWPAEIRPHLMMGYRVPAFSDSTSDTAALDLVGLLLFGESAPLYRTLVVDEQWVDFLQGAYNNHRDPFLFLVYSRIKSGDLVPKVQAAIDEHLRTLQNEPVDPQRLERLKSYLRYSFAAGMDSPANVGFTLTSYLALTGDPGSINRLYGQYEKVTAADVQRVAREIFRSEGQTVVTLGHEAPSVAAAESETTVEGE